MDVKIPTEGASRSASLLDMSKLLREYDSEYHFLCMKVLEFEKAGIESAPRNEAAALVRVERELENIAALDQRRKREALARAAEKKAAENAAKKKDQLCTAARNLYLGFMEHSGIYRRNEAGERVYYSAAEIDAERIRSKQRMDDECQ